MSSRNRNDRNPAALRDRLRPFGSALIGLLAILAAPPASCDRLVLDDGSTVETAGPWRVEGRLVVFELPGGRLASLKLDDVLLAASEEATAAEHAARNAPPPPAEPRPPRKKAVLVLTDADIPRGRDAAEAPQEIEAAGDRGAAADRRVSDASSLTVLSWEAVESPAGDGFQIYGTVENQGAKPLAGAGVEVFLYDAGGGLIASAEARLAQPVLPSQARSNFIAAFPGVVAYDTAELAPYDGDSGRRERPAAPERGGGGGAERLVEPLPPLGE